MEKIKIFIIAYSKYTHRLCIQISKIYKIIFEKKYRVVIYASSIYYMNNIVWTFWVWASLDIVIFMFQVMV